MIEDLEDDIYEIFNSYFSKDATRVFHKIDIRKYGFLTLSKFADSTETLGEGFHLSFKSIQIVKLFPSLWLIALFFL